MWDRPRIIKKRLSRHNHGEVTSTAKYRPWKIQTAIAFDEASKAVGIKKVTEERIRACVC
jgi:hypothetical protein